jgi:hypothetical protein
MKIIMQCPNCHFETILTLENKLSSGRVKNLFENNSTYCTACASQGLGKIILKVIKFDHDKKVESNRSKQDLHTPSWIDPDSISKEKRKALLEKELKTFP